jgi:uncharacterized protein (TIGR02001 family)
MKLKTISALCLAASTLVATSSAMAWESEDGVWSTSGNVALTTNYIFRGVSQTDNEPAIQGGFDLGHSSGLYAGIWASNIDYPGSDANIEIDYYAGFAGDFGDSGVSYDISGLYYDYTNVNGAGYLEFIGSVSYSYFTTGIAYSNDFVATDTDATYYFLDAAYDISSVTLAAGVGYYDIDDETAAGLESYTNFYVGASTELAGIGFDLTYQYVDEDDLDTDEVVFTISKSM